MHLRLLHRAQEGFTTVTLMGVLMVGGLLVAATFTAVQPDIAFTKKDDDSKQAYAAAEAGVNYYLNRLGQDNSYYTKCAGVQSPSLNAVNLEWNGTGADPRIWQTIQGSTAQYTTELLAVQDPNTAGTELCDTTKNGAGMVDPKTGTFRIRATGRSRTAANSNDRPVKRSIIATFRRKSFIDFLYFTDFETLDPYAYPTGGTYDPTWAANNCAVYRPSRSTNCQDPDFIDSDSINGPLKTNDSISVCGSPDFGRDANDDIELNGDSPGWVSGCSGAAPNFKGVVDWPAGQLPMPQSNAQLEASADPSYVFNGETKLVFNGTTVSVTNNGTTTSMPMPPAGVIYVNSTSCNVGYSRQQTYTASSYMSNPGCGNAWISGTYNSDITIGADNDIVVTDDFKSNNLSTVLGGLVANNFVRVFHPANSFGTNGFGGTTCTNDSGGPGAMEIDAAILALNHSFITDNWYCGSPLGTLTVKGAIAQKYRGTVGTHSGGTVVSGYSKAYSYNDTLRYREPPFFINPTESAWRLVRQNEQVPAR
jgi:Tfp pilus assembly protein PilX